MADLETRLRALGAQAQWPSTPDVATAIRGRLAGAPPRRDRRRAVALAIALALLVPAAAVAAVPGARHAVLDWLGLRSVRVRTVPAPPRAAGRPLDPTLGRRTTLRDARRRLAFAVRVPAALAAPDRVYLARTPPGGRVTLVYAARPGRPRLIVTQFRGSRTRAFLEKSVGPGTTVQRLRVGRAPGAWLAGRPHGFVYADAHGVIREEDTRLAGNVLVWERDGVVLRLEGRLTRARALRFARSFR